MIVVYESSTSYKVMFELELFREVFGIAEGMLVQLSVNTFNRCSLEHLWTYVNTVNIFESLIGEVLSNQSCTTSHIKDSNFA